jgi:hypothetical protein
MANTTRGGLGPQGFRGPKGDTGIQGPTGPAGTQGASGVDYIYESSGTHTLPTTYTTNKILNVVNTGNGPINITYGTSTITLSKHTYASFIYNNSTWNMVTY